MGLFGLKLGGFLTKTFKKKLDFQFVEKELIKAVLEHKQNVDGRIYVPNLYLLEVSQADYQRLCTNRFMRILNEALHKLIIERNLFAEGEIVINLAPQDIKDGSLTINAKFIEDDYTTAEAAGDETRVLNPVADLLDRTPDYLFASLLAIEGPDIDSYLSFGKKEIKLGRLVKNDFILTDREVSRVHAYILMKDNRHWIFDADSSNGTFVNEERITEGTLLNAKDEIELGGSVILYDVIGEEK